MSFACVGHLPAEGDSAAQLASDSGDNNLLNSGVPLNSNSAMDVDEMSNGYRPPAGDE